MQVNNVVNWSWDKPTQEGLYLVCRGDVETPDNIQPVRIVDNESKISTTWNNWPVVTFDEIASWHKSIKFAELNFN